jgi:predicted transcriptional regulator
MQQIESIKKKMQLNKITQQKLAKQTGLSQPHISNILSGRKKPMLSTFLAMEEGIEKLTKL